MRKKELLQKLFGGMSPLWRAKAEAKVLAVVKNKKVVKSLTTAELLAVQVRIADLKTLGGLEETLNPRQGDLL